MTPGGFSFGSFVIGWNALTLLLGVGAWSLLAKFEHALAGEHNPLVWLDVRSGELHLSRC